jgi:hypothetical protein
MAAYSALCSSPVIWHAEEGLFLLATGTMLRVSLMDDGGNGWGALLLQLPPSLSLLRQGCFTEVMKGQGRRTTMTKTTSGTNIPDGNEPWKWLVLHRREIVSAISPCWIVAPPTNKISPNSNNPAALMAESENKEVAINCMHFLILARYCASSSLNFMRLGQI